jgi:acetyltransferase-like isoleucine patch superfamily enzyme
MTIAAPPTALPPTRRTLRHRLRATRAGLRRGVTIEGAPYLGRGVVLDLTEGARLTIADRAVLMDGCRIHARGGVVTIGAGAVLGERCVILSHDRVEVGARAMLADGAVLVDFRHRHGDTELPTRLQGLATGPVRIPDGARVGPGAVVEGVR